MSSEIQAIQNQALGAVKQAEDEAFLDSIKKKAEQQKIQQEQQRQKIQEFHLQDQQRQDVSKVQEQNKIEFKALEQVAKLLNQQPETLQPQSIKDVLPLLQKAESEALQRILESQNLQDIQKKFKESKLEDQGIKSRFSNEMQMLQSIAKVLKIPVESLTQEQIQSYLKQNKSEEYIPRTRRESAVNRRQGSNESSDSSTRLSSRLTQIKALLSSLGSKQEEIMRQMGQQKNLKRDLEKVAQQIGKLEGKLNQLRDELSTGSPISEEELKNKAALQESASDIKQNIRAMRDTQTSLQKMLYDSGEASSSDILDSLSDLPEDLPIAKLKELLQLSVSTLSSNQLNKLSQIVDKNKSLVEELQENAHLIQNDDADFNSKSVSQWLLQTSPKVESEEKLKPESKPLSFSENKQDDKEDPISAWVGRFKSASQEGDESLAPLIIELRKGHLSKSPEFSQIIKQLVDQKLLTAENLRNDFGLVLGSDQSAELRQATKPEALAAMLRLLNIPEDTPITQLPPMVQAWIGKERVSRQDFEKMKNCSISEMSWDFGFIRFNESSVGFLRERAEINSFFHFEAWMTSLAGGDDELSENMQNLFLAKDAFTPLERDLGSLFLSEYEDFLIDPEHPLHDLYANFLASRTFSQLGENDREELVVGVLLRLIANIESDRPNEVFRQYLSYAEKPQKSLSFQRFLEITDYVFSEGGSIRPSFLDLKTPLQFVREQTTWDEEQEKRVAMYTISEMVKGMSVPVKQSPKIKLRSMADRLKDRFKK